LNYLENLNTVIIDTASAGNNTLIAAPGAGKYIAIDFISFFPTTANTIQLYSGAVEKSGPLPLDAKQTITWENAMQNEHGVITCGNNEAFIINLSGAVQLGGVIRYRIVGN
jgi:hypothetical protein